MIEEKNLPPQEESEQPMPIYQKRWFKIAAICFAVAFVLGSVAWALYIALRPAPPEPIRGVYVYDRYEYTVLEDDTIKILTYTGEESEVYIPIALEGRLVSTIGEYAFSSNQAVEHVKLHPMIREIEPYAFYNCTALKSVDFSEGLTKIGTAAFHRCIILEEVVLPESLVEMGDMVFSQCLALKKAELSSKIAYIGIAGFGNCSSLESIVLPEACTEIGEKAFMGCTKLLEITIPEGIQKIGGYAFQACEKLSSLNFYMASEIGEAPVVGAAMLESISVDAQNPAYKVVDGALYETATATLLAYPSAAARTELSVESGTKILAPHVFAEAKSLVRYLFTPTPAWYNHILLITSKSPRLWCKRVTRSVLIERSS
jgi:hypothetical protein